MYHQRTTSKPRSRTVHKSGWVRFVPNPNSDPMDSGGEKFNPQPTRFEFQVCRFGSYWFRVHIGRFRVRQSGAKFGRIWLKYCRISSDLVGSNKIKPIFPCIYKYRAKILMDLVEIYLSDGLKGFDLPVFGRVCDFRRGKNSSLGGSGSSVSQTTNPQLKPMVSVACADDSRPIVTKL